MAGLLLYVLCEYLYRQKRIHLALHLIASAFGLGGVIASGTRTTLIVFAALIAYFHSRILLFMLIPLSLGFGIFAETYFKSGEISRFFDRYVTDDRFSTRGDSYTQAASAFHARPSAYLIGFGSGSAGDTLAVKYSEQSYINITSHNIILKYAFEYGIPGGVVFCLVFGAAWRSVGASEIGTYLGRPLLILLALCGMSFSAVEAWPVNVYIGLMIGCASQLSRVEAQD
jgi:O-antigen ligase